MEGRISRAQTTDTAPCAEITENKLVVWKIIIVPGKSNSTFPTVELRILLTTRMKWNSWK
jgi:hypothetical protein